MVQPSHYAEDAHPSFKQSPPLFDIWGCLFILLVSAGVYRNSLNAGFVFDDHRAILTNKDLETDGERTIFDLFYNDFWGGAMSRTQSHKSYRPLTVLSYRYLNYLMFGREPFTYHLINVLLHSAVSISVYHLSRLLVRDSLSSLFASLLFSVHSIHTEAVANTVGRAEILSALFYVLAILVYMRSIRGYQFYSHIFLSVFLSACAMLSKEQGITSIGICIIADVLLHWNQLILVLCNLPKYLGATRAVVRERVDWIPNFAVIHSLIVRCVILGISGTALMFFRLKMNHGSQPIFNETELRLLFHSDRHVRVMSMGYLYAFNYWLLLCPYQLCCDWTHPSILPVLSLSDSRNIWLPLLLLLFSALSFRCISSREDRLPLGMSIALIIIPFIPATGIIFRIGFIIAERVLYLPSIGHCILTAYGADKLKRHLHFSYFRKLLYIFCLFVVLIQVWRTWLRNEDWLSDLNLYKSGVKLNPQNPKMHNNYAMELKDSGRDAEAELHYLRALEIEPDYADSYFNLGNLYADLNMHEKALEMFIKSASFGQMRAKTMNNLATMYMKLQRYSEAEKAFHEQIAMNPNHNMAHNNLASLYGQTGRRELAKKHFLKALEINPSYAEGHFNLGTLYYQLDQLDLAEDHLRRSIHINPKHKGAVNNLNVVLYAKNQKPN
ncbi:Transmembrane and TPR repeat-containing protein 4-like [Oopsacas minuta]|uniref:dolichyl-phosphate-mannose--protein mannosyltransferase n=1 Tax=Oopsacas minuta TaxID=111878 RepID=A0AAV7K2M1_9METZ|nr:Transmembrane and TPR repeat-containing protein 4-like [Oopsacas minuta]